MCMSDIIVFEEAAQKLRSRMLSILLVAAE